MEGLSQSLSLLRLLLRPTHCSGEPFAAPLAWNECEV